MEKKVIHFEEGGAEMKALLGGKGANLAEMTKLGMPIPPGFTISTEACNEFLCTTQRLSDSLIAEIEAATAKVEAKKAMVFGDPERPLLVSVRSGSVVSMPGMMDTILNLGLNDETVAGLAAITNKPAFALDCYRRLIQMFGNVVLGVQSIHFEQILHKIKASNHLDSDQEMSEEAWKTVIAEYKKLILQKTGQAFPQNVNKQLKMAVEAVFKSWNNPRAKVYRKAYGIPDELGTAVNIQSMVFGNFGEDSGTGVLFTRNPSTGEHRLYGEYLANAQGEDVVAGVRTPKPLDELKTEMPDIHSRLVELSHALESHYKDMQDIEFTIERRQLYVLQTRSGKRTAQASVKIAIDLSEEGIITPEEAVMRIEPKHLDQLLHRSIDESKNFDVIAKGLPASPGAAAGQIVFDADKAEQWAKEGREVLLVSEETSPEDIHGVIAAQGILTSRGGMTSHAAVVARGMGKPCVCGCDAISIHREEAALSVAGQTIREGEWLSIDGASGQVIAGRVSLNDPEISDELQKLLEMADKIRKLKIYTNADNPQDAGKAREFGAEGVGLCRTEHMFMSPARLPFVQKMIMADNDATRQEALDVLLPMQQSDFEGIFEAMDGLPVTIRLLDPPLHEFLPGLEELLQEKERLQNNPADDERKAELNLTIRKVRELQEMNPMLGLRGCRLGILFPQIYDMQIEAIFKAVLKSLQKNIKVFPEIMIPLVGDSSELQMIRESVDKIAEQVLGEERKYCRYKVGTMIEVPRAAITAGQIAKFADFFSFGTNDLTQMTYGYSRDDAEGKFLSHYLDRNILPHNPFQVLDREGVGTLIEWAVTKGRSQKSTLKAGICGEHGGDQQSIYFCHQIGLDYVSCSPYRVPFARIAAAQAAVVEQTEDGNASLQAAI